MTAHCKLCEEPCTEDAVCSGCHSKQVAVTKADHLDLAWQRDRAEAELREARRALGVAWLFDGASLAEGIRRKTASLERIDDDAEGAP